jgi:hypothetical protein
MDLIIVGDESDRFCGEVAEIAMEKGYDVAILDVYDAARVFSIGIEDGQAFVTPDIPMILRMSPPAAVRASFDDSFQYGECLATLWAAAALSKSTVINRPTANSIWGRTSYSSVLTKLNAGAIEEQVEIFSSQAPTPPSKQVNKEWYLQDLVTYNTTPYPEIPKGEGPYRARWSEPDPAYEIVVVLDDKAWRCTNISLEHLELEEKSIFLVRNLDLIFGAVIWNISEDLTDTTIARIDSFPLMEQLQFVWPALAPALLEVLFQ